MGAQPEIEQVVAVYQNKINRAISRNIAHIAVTQDGMKACLR